MHHLLFCSPRKQPVPYKVTLLSKNILPFFFLTRSLSFHPPDPRSFKNILIFYSSILIPSYFNLPILCQQSALAANDFYSFLVAKESVRSASSRLEQLVRKTSLALK